jgi:hypothetical protein
MEADGRREKKRATARKSKKRKEKRVLAEEKRNEKCVMGLANGPK